MVQFFIGKLAHSVFYRRSVRIFCNSFSKQVYKGLSGMGRIIFHFGFFLKHQSDVCRLVFSQDSICRCFQVICKVFDGFLVVHVASVLNLKDKLISLN